MATDDEEVPTYETLDLEGNRELLVAVGANLLPEKNWSRNSDNFKRATIPALAATDLHAHVRASLRDAMPDTASEATAGRWGKIVGAPRKGATPASAEDAGQVRGTVGSSWATTDTLVHKSGLRFRPSESGTLDASGLGLTGIVAIDVGPETRLVAGEILTWEIPPAGLESEVRLVADLDVGGADKEELGAFRTRYLSRFAQPAMGGNHNDFVQWIVESNDAIAEGYVWGHRNGRGSIDIAGLKTGTGTTRILDAGENADLEAYVEAVRPVASGTPRALTVVAQTQAVELIITPESDLQWAADWTSAVPMEVDSWTPGTRTLVFTTDRPPSMRVGDRIVVEGTPGVPMIIEALSSTDAVVLKDALGQTPVAASAVYAGGPLTVPVRDAVIALFDSLGPELGEFGRGWDDSLRLSRLNEVVQAPEGMLDVEIVTPVATVTPTAYAYPNDDQVGLLVPGSVLVRYTA